ncbi:MAG: DUF502 domain-containing protein [Verrucomicrobiota bacterium]|jgi:uncharacterized membrane protein|nr:DUF502 domain-containing protein [Verrucomicrobiota bacterium]MDP7050140.1 DUF502 domain-containing protein [Verrucomicrobiota bacterium]
MSKRVTLLGRTRRNFFTGLAVVLPVIISIGVALWLFNQAVAVSDILLYPFRSIPGLEIWKDGKPGSDLYFGWKVVAILEAVVLTGLLGFLTRYYVGKKLVQLMDYILLNVPLLGKIYGTVKQVNQAFTSENKSNFQQVVMVEFPRKGLNSVGFVTAEQVKTDEGESIISIFVPTTPNPTTGFLLVLPESKVVKLDMSVADGIKYIVSLGAVPPENASGVQAAFKAEAARMLSDG